jgi:lipopolysaccharide transport system permease protein
MLIFLTPVIYPTNIVRPSFRFLLALNPMTGVVESIRSVFEGSPINWDVVGLSLAVSVTIFLAGVFYFKLSERNFADIV